MRVAQRNPRQSPQDQLNSTHCNKGLRRGSSSSTTLSSSSTSSSPPPFSPLPNPRTKTMEEVWKDINLSSLHDQPSRDDSNSASFPGMIFQDFLARPFAKESQATAGSARYGSPAPPPATMLTLNSGPEFHLLGSSDPLRQNSLLQPQPISNVCSLNVPFDDFGSCPAINANGKERCPDPDKNSGDRRHKRMIKNRESAARSRARKQAYMQELELSVRNLTEENARLKEQQRQLCLAAADRQRPKKRTLHRTSTAPF